MNDSSSGMPARPRMRANRRSFLAAAGAAAAMVGMDSPAAAAPAAMGGDDVLRGGTMAGSSARFAAVPSADEAFTLPHSGGNKRTFNFDLPGLIVTPTDSTVIIMFKVKISGEVRLRMRINNNPGLSIDFTLDPPAGWRSWHEIVGPKAGVKASGNVLSVLAEGPGAGKVTVSDIVFLYHATVS